MNHNQKIELQTHLSNLLDKKIDIFAEDDHYYSLRLCKNNLENRRILEDLLPRNYC